MIFGLVRTEQKKYLNGEKEERKKDVIDGM